MIPKGSAHLISETPDTGNYEGVKVIGYSVKTVNVSIAQLRAKHESSSMLSAARHHEPSHHEISGAMMDQQKLHLN
jgi:hypothetical protein